MDIDSKQQALVGFLSSHPWVGDRGEQQAEDQMTFKTATMRERERDEIERQTAEFLARGGHVETVTAADNSAAKQPIKLSRKEQFRRFQQFNINRR